MNDFNKFFKEKKISKYRYIKKFNSKKNDVYLLECIQNDIKNIWVLKEYRTNKADSYIANKEINILHQLNNGNIEVPKIIYGNENFIIMEYINGNNFVDILDEAEIKFQNNCKDFSEEYYISLFIKLFIWLRDFYDNIKITTNKAYIFGDVNLRNFILKQDKVFGIDFEDVIEGCKEKDAGKIFAYILTYTPSFTHFKCNLVNSLIKIISMEFGYERIIIKKEMVKELNNINMRRKNLNT